MFIPFYFIPLLQKYNHLIILCNIFINLMTVREYFRKGLCLPRHNQQFIRQLHAYTLTKQQFLGLKHPSKLGLLPCCVFLQDK
jgi:hypothetical protein